MDLLGKLKLETAPILPPNMRHLGAYCPFPEKKMVGFFDIPNHDARASSVDGLTEFKMALVVSLSLSSILAILFANICRYLQ